MADFVAVLRRAIDSLDTNTPETRAALYDKARGALLVQLRALDPPISDEDLAQQAETLDLAIARLEAEYSGPDAEEAHADPDEPDAAASDDGADDGPSDGLYGDDEDDDEKTDRADPAPTTPAGSKPDEDRTDEGETGDRSAAAAAAAGVAAAADAARAAPTTPPQGGPRPPQGPQAGQRPQEGQRPQPGQRPDTQGQRPDTQGQRPGAPGPGNPGQRPGSAQRPQGAPAVGRPDPAGRPSRPAEPSAAASRVRDGQAAGEEAAARSRASAAAYEAETAAAPKPRRGRTVMLGVVALVILLLALVGLWQSGLIFGPGSDQIAGDETKIDDRLDGETGTQDEAPQSQYEVPEPTQEVEQPAPAEPEVATPDATGEQAPRLTDQPTPPGASAQAILIEEATGGPGSSNTLGGSVQWELVSENSSQGPGQMISGTVSIPDRNLNLMLTIRRNTDTDLPASHTIELVFDAPDGFGGGGIANVPGMIMKATPRSTGQPLVGAVVPVTENFFLVGLSESDLDRQRNINEMRQRDFIDVPLVYEDGGRAVLSIAKGDEGQNVFNQAFDAWQ